MEDMWIIHNTPASPTTLCCSHDYFSVGLEYMLNSNGWELKECLVGKEGRGQLFHKYSGIHVLGVSIPIIAQISGFTSSQS